MNSKGSFRMQKYKWRYPFTAFLLAFIMILIVSMLVKALTEQVSMDLNWATLGLGVLVAYVVRDILIFHGHGKDNTRIIFTNFRDTFVIVFSLLVASGFSYILQATLSHNLFVNLAVYLLAILLALLIFYFCGSRELRVNTLPTIFQRNFD